MLENGADIEAMDEEGQVPLHRAASIGHKAVVRLLLDWGANIEAEDEEGHTPLHNAVRCANDAVVRLLLQRGGPNPESVNVGPPTKLNSWTS